MSNTPHTPSDIGEMLAAAGADSIDGLFDGITRQAEGLRLPAGVGEYAALMEIQRVSERNSLPVSFTGGGFYSHFIPAAVDRLSSLPGFLTPYTPYQPEASQGTLQALYEYQSVVCRLTGMEAANASVYDGGTALAEAVLMSIRISGRKRAVIDGGVNPVYRRILDTYLRFHDSDIVVVEASGCSTDRAKLLDMINEDTACVVFQNPNFFGEIDDYSDISEAAHAAGALSIGVFYPISLGLLKPPADMGADIAAGEGQSLGNPLNFGGPYLGMMACRKKYIRMLPGRIAGRTADVNGRDAFVLTLQAREQHIKRQRASSNICTNENLCALRALIYLAVLGKDGLQKTASNCAGAAAFAAGLIDKTAGVSILNRNFFNEFVIRLPVPAIKVREELSLRGYAAGIPLNIFYKGRENELLLSFTEISEKSEIEEFAEILGESLK